MTANDDVSRAVIFREVDLDHDAEICLQFRIDSFVESFGSAERVFQAAGEGGKDYLAGLRAKNREWPGSCVHAWLGNEIIGQVEMRRQPADRSRAHVLLYYLRPDMRGRGFGSELDANVLRSSRAAGVDTTTLRVSPSNARAMAFYRKHGWHDRGRDPQHPDVHVMERSDTTSPRETS
jgi:ribosomal protein S18 acetylase RimI-like enzyme